MYKCKPKCTYLQNSVSQSLLLKHSEFWVTPYFPPGSRTDLKSLFDFQLTTRSGQEIEGSLPLKM